jgi:hypothetical protein
MKTAGEELRDEAHRFRVWQRDTVALLIERQEGDAC